LLITAALATALLAGPARAADFFREEPFLKITGEIVAGDFARFKRIVPRRGPDDQADWIWMDVVLDSPGGILREGLAIGRHIHKERDFDTVVRINKRCVSVCALIWLAGNRRTLFPGAGVGFHAAYDDNGTSGVGNAVIGAYLRDLGMPLSVIVFATSAPPDGIAWLTETKAKELGLGMTVLSGRIDPPPTPPTPPSGYRPIWK
jgi:hypothetical protein